MQDPRQDQVSAESQSITSAQGVEPTTLFDRVIRNEGDIKSIFNRLSEFDDVLSQLVKDLNEAHNQLGLN